MATNISSKNSRIGPPSSIPCSPANFTCKRSLGSKCFRLKALKPPSITLSRVTLTMLTQSPRLSFVSFSNSRKASLSVNIWSDATRHCTLGVPMSTKPNSCSSADKSITSFSDSVPFATDKLILPLGLLAERWVRYRNLTSALLPLR